MKSLVITEITITQLFVKFAKLYNLQKSEYEYGLDHVGGIRCCESNESQLITNLRAKKVLCHRIEVARISGATTTDCVFCNVIGYRRITPGKALSNQLNEDRGIGRRSPDPFSLEPRERAGSGHETTSEEVGHAYGRARNAVSRMVSKHCKISVATALEVRFCTCPVAGTRSCRSIILGSRIVEMGYYCSCVSVALGSQNFAARAS